MTIFEADEMEFYTLTSPSVPIEEPYRAIDSQKRMSGMLSRLAVSYSCSETFRFESTVFLLPFKFRFTLVFKTLAFFNEPLNFTLHASNGNPRRVLTLDFVRFHVAFDLLRLSSAFTC